MWRKTSKSWGRWTAFQGITRHRICSETRCFCSRPKWITTCLQVTAQKQQWYEYRCGFLIKNSWSLHCTSCVFMLQIFCCIIVNVYPSIKFCSQWTQWTCTTGIFFGFPLFLTKWKELTLRAFPPPRHPWGNPVVSTLEVPGAFFPHQNDHLRGWKQTWFFVRRILWPQNFQNCHLFVWFFSAKWLQNCCLGLSEIKEQQGKSSIRAKSKHYFQHSSDAHTSHHKNVIQ